MKNLFIVKFPKINKKKNLLILAINQNIWFLREKSKLMNSKPLLKECKCIHCKQKLDQINSSRLYWEKLIVSKNLA